MSRPVKIGITVAVLLALGAALVVFFSSDTTSDASRPTPATPVAVPAEVLENFEPQELLRDESGRVLAVPANQNRLSPRETRQFSD